MGVNWTEVAVLMLVVVLLFGGKVSGLLTDLAAGLKSFKREMSKPDEPPQTNRQKQETGTGKDSAHDV